MEKCVWFGERFFGYAAQGEAEGYFRCEVKQE
jgi:hypothetical protein